MASALARDRGSTSDTSYRVEITWNVDMNVTGASKCSLTADHNNLALAGYWATSLVGNGDVLQFSLRFDVSSTAYAGHEVRSEFEFYRLDAAKNEVLIDKKSLVGPLVGRDAPKRSWTIPSVTWEGAARRSRGSFRPESHRLYRFKAIIERSSRPAPASSKEGKTNIAPALAQRAAALHHRQLPHDIRLFFPASSGTDAELWASSSTLLSASPYFKALLDSDFAESVPRRSKRARTEGVTDVASQPADNDGDDFEDSDNETDESLFSKRPPTIEQSSEADDVSYRQITVSQTAYSTYHAILVYLYTGFIRFAPLLATSAKARVAALEASFDADPSLPLPVSPKSVFRFAHLLRLVDLQEEALEAFRSSLTVQNAAAELFSDASLAYEDLRTVVIDYVKDNWEGVKISKWWTHYRQKIKAREAGNHEELAAILMEVLEAVA